MVRVNCENGDQGCSWVGDFWGTFLRERPPGLIQHVLTVLVFWSCVPLRPRLPPSLRLFPWASILLHGPLDICLGLVLAAPHTTCAKTGRTADVFTAQGGTRRFPGLNGNFPRPVSDTKTLENKKTISTTETFPLCPPPLFFGKEKSLTEAGPVYRGRSDHRTLSPGP